MFSLIMGSFAASRMDVDRVFEHTDDELAQFFLPAKPAGRERLTSLPALVLPPRTTARRPSMPSPAPFRPADDGAVHASTKGCSCWNSGPVPCRVDCIGSSQPQRRAAPAGATDDVARR